MALSVGMFHFECDDALAVAAFWSGALGIPVDEGASSELAMIDFAKAHGPTWIFQRTPGLPRARNRVAIDLGGEDDRRDEAERLEGLGATRLGDFEQDGARWIELDDVEGNLLRVFAARPGDEIVVR